MSNTGELFFTWIWRINGLLFLLVLICAGGVLLAMLIASLASHSKQQATVQEIAGADIHSEELFLGDFRNIQGTDFLFTVLSDAEQNSLFKGGTGSKGEGGSYIGAGSWKGYGSRNVLFFDTMTKSARWLFAKNDQDILTLSFAYDPPRKYSDYGNSNQTSNEKAVAIIVEFSQRHSEQEKDTPNPHMVEIADIGGANKKTVLSGIDRLLGYQQPDGKTLLLFYISTGIARVMNYNLETQSVISDGTIAADTRS